jgi:hypothetical protein
MTAAVQGIGNFFSNIGNLFSAPKAPSLQAPNELSKTPTQAEANTTTVNQELKNEQAASSTSTVLTGGSGLLDQPTTTSRVLIGN